MRGLLLILAGLLPVAGNLFDPMAGYIPGSNVTEHTSAPASQERFRRQDYAAVEALLARQRGEAACFGEAQALPWFTFRASPKYYTNGHNFGDDFNADVGAALLGLSSRDALRMTTQNAPDVSSSPKLVAVGSVMHFASPGDAIFGTGIRSRRDKLKRNARGNGKLRVYAVRGPLTQAELGKAGVRAPKLFGDPGLLAPRVVWPELRHNASADVACVLPHGRDKPAKQEAVQLIAVLGIRLRLLDTSTHPPRALVASLLQCSLLISGSLHGLVFADAYGVPAVWLRNDATEPAFKYEDYFASVRGGTAPSVKSIKAGLAQKPMPLVKPALLLSMSLALISAFPFAAVCGQHGPKLELSSSNAENVVRPINHAHTNPWGIRPVKPPKDR
eukprot:scaffold4766_cov115-Isochrysis_galbana.AAC.13